MTTKETALNKISELVQRFDEQYNSYKKSEYNETLTRRDFIDPFFKALGWDMDNESGNAEAYREVIHEDKIKVASATKSPDYSFRLIGGKRLFFVEAKKPSVSIKDDVDAAYQIRRYGWSAKLSISIITDFEEFAIYDCTQKPNHSDKASVARIKYLTYKDYIKDFDFLWDTFSKEKVLKGSFDKYVQSDTHKKGTATVDKEFLNSLDKWRTKLASNISQNNIKLGEDEINFAVQHTIDRIIFLRIAEDRNVEPYGNLKGVIEKGNYYKNLFKLFISADEKYNSGLFDFEKDQYSKNLNIDNKVLETIIEELYYPESPYEFSVLSVEILGSAYEQFLGKVIRILPSHKTKIELKPEVRKAGGVYYTPQYIVEYIVDNTVGELIKDKTPDEVSKIKIVDPACGSGSFLIGAYQKLLDFHKDYYNSNEKYVRGKKNSPLAPDGNLTTAEKKRILTNNIFGVDIDANAVEVTKLSLLLKCLEGETAASIAYQMSMFNQRVLPDLDGNIKCGNSLIGTDFYKNENMDLFDKSDFKKVNAFDWDKEFPEIFKQGGFDAVIGNPPYVNVKNQDITIREFFNNNNFYSSSADLYVYFIEKAISIVKKNGLIGFITPNKFFGAKYGIKLRYKLKDGDSTILRIWDLKDVKVFLDASISTIVFIIIKNKNKCDVILLKNNFISTISNIFDNDGKIQIEQNIETKKIIAKLETNPRLIKYADIRTGIVGFEYWKMSDIISNSHGNNSVKLFLNGNFKRYENSWGTREVNLYKTKFLKPFIKLDEKYLSKGTIDLFKKKPKIVVRGVAKCVSGIIDFAGGGLLVAVHSIIPKGQINIYYLLGLINSKLINYYHLKVFYSIQIPEGSLKYPIAFFQNIPIPDVDVNNKHFSKLEDKISNLVQEMIRLSKEYFSLKKEMEKAQLKKKIDIIDNQIDRLVYELYGLTEEEIKVVEGK